eukprot:scaffold35291_cov47-Attheya_sp.AAC.3
MTLSVSSAQFSELPRRPPYFRFVVLLRRFIDISDHRAPQCVSAVVPVSSTQGYQSSFTVQIKRRRHQ